MTTRSNERGQPVATPSPCSVRYDLPVNLSNLVGREHERQELADLLAGSRLLTLIGAGGVGKTRLAIAVADAARAECADGVWFVELAPVGRSDIVPKTVASVLQVQEQPGRELVQTLAEVLRFKELLL